MEKDNIFKEEKKILDKDAKDPKIAKTELNDDELDEVAGGIDPLALFKTVKDVLTK